MLKKQTNPNYLFLLNFKHTILLLEDETDSAELLSGFLEMDGFNLKVASNGKEALDIINENAAGIDLAILDIMVPEINGIEVCKFIRNHPVIRDIPVIFLTAKDQENDEIFGLEAGADDYISKPASFKLISTRIKTLLRRQVDRGTGWVHVGNIYLDLGNKQVWRNNNAVDLTNTEFILLKTMAESPNRVFTRQELLETITDEDKFVFDRTVDVHIKNLRIKLGSDGEVVKTYRGTGYGINRELIGS